MIVKISDIYKQVSEESGFSYELVSSIGSTVFASLLEKLNKPYDISYELPRLGAFNLRHDTFDPYYRAHKKYSSVGAISSLEEVERVDLLMDKINQFRLAKKEARSKRKKEIYEEESY